MGRNGPPAHIEHVAAHRVEAILSWHSLAPRCSYYRTYTPVRAKRQNVVCVPFDAKLLARQGANHIKMKAPPRKARMSGDGRYQRSQAHPPNIPLERDRRNGLVLMANENVRESSKSDRLQKA